MDLMGLNTDKRIRLGIWGLGRGMSFYRSCDALGIDVVAGCDYDERLRSRFLKSCPNAMATDDSEKFLKYDMDAVLVATYCTEHAEDSIKALEAGRHVLSEVTSFHTMAQGVELTEAVEKSGLCYQMAENYPFSKANLFLAQQYRRGLFGELQYAEFEYVHNCLKLAYTYMDGVPIIPGNTVHYWRSWQNYHYYNTHSLGPVMHITGLRPTRVVALPAENGVPGFLDAEYQGMAPSLINLSNGSIMRNLMGATPNDTYSARLWGTTGAAENSAAGLYLKLGGGLGDDSKLKLKVEPDWPEGFGDLAEKAGHSGGDFWVLYHFAREIREGIPGPFNIYRAADCTSAGILAYRSAIKGGKPYTIPDLKSKTGRNEWRNDHFEQPRYDVSRGCFAPDADPDITEAFAGAMSALIKPANTYLSLSKWSSVLNVVGEADKDKIRKMKTQFISELGDIQEIYKKARAIVDAYPESDGARVLGEMLAIGGEHNVRSGSFSDWGELL